MELSEVESLSSDEYAELVAGEEDPWEAGDVGLEWRSKDRHVVVHDEDGRLVAAAGLVLADAEFGEHWIRVVGIGGVIVTASRRGQGLGWRVIAAAVRRAGELGPELAMLFCRPDRAELYRRHGFSEVPRPVLVEQPDGVIEMPLVTMWRPLKDGSTLPAGPMRLRGLPF